MQIILEESFALDDSCQFRYWARGHWNWSQFMDAVRKQIGIDNRDIPLWVVRQALVKQTFQRVVPCRNNGVSDSQFINTDIPGPGAYPVTLMEFWFPLHAYKDEP